MVSKEKQREKTLRPPEQNGHFNKNQHNDGLNPYVPFHFSSKVVEQQPMENGNKGKKKEKTTHKKINGNPLHKGNQNLERYLRRWKLIPNVITAVEEGRVRWNSEKRQIEFIPENQEDTQLHLRHGGIAYKRVSRRSRYEDKVRITVVDEENKPHRQWFVPVRGVKSESWIFPPGPRRRIDTMPIPTREKEKEKPTPRGHVGMEFEMLVPGGLEGELSEETKTALAALGADISPEFLAETVEIGFDHSSTIREQMKNNLLAMQILNNEIHRQGRAMLPVSMHPDKLTEAHVNNHPYITGMRKALGRLNCWIYGSSNSFQTMHDNRNSHRGRGATRRWYEVINLYKLPTRDSTVAYGTIHPNMRSIVLGYKKEGALIPRDEQHLDYVDSDEPSSTREPARYFGSTVGGGENTELFPLRTKDYLRVAESITSTEINGDNREETSPSIDRVGGGGKNKGRKARALHHGNMRYRHLIGPTTANEIAVADTIGGHFVKLTAMAELGEAINQRLNALSDKELHRLNPKLFRRRLTDASIPTLIKNALQIDAAQNAQIIGADKKIYAARELARELVAFASQPIDDEAKGIHLEGLPRGITEELYKSLQIPTEEDLLKARGTEVIEFKGKKIIKPSIRGWYENGIGDPAYIRRLRIKALEELGWSGEAIIDDYKRDGQIGYDEHLREMAGDYIEALYINPQSPTGDDGRTIYTAAA